MKFIDTIEPGCRDASLQRAFRDYFAELGVSIRDWDGLFAEIDAADDQFLVRRDETGAVAGFLLFARKEMTCGFFTAILGCVEEFYIAPNLRGQGHGAALLAAAEEELRRMGCGYGILTTDTAAGFYQRQGYRHTPSISAKNSDPVFVKPLEPPAGM